MSAEPIQGVPEAVEEVEKAEKSERGRSRIEWPYFSLDEATKLAKGIFELGGTRQIDQLAGHLNQSATGGGFRLKVQAARTFGLVTSHQGMLALTDLGSQILQPEFEREAKVEAFLKVPLYNALHDKYKNRILPPTIGLENAMVELGVAAKQKDKARQAFQRSAKEAGFFAFGATKLVMPVLPVPINSPEKSTKTQDETPNPNGAKEKVGTSSGGGGNDGGGLDPSIRGLLNKLPDVTQPWPLEGRRRWLRAALTTFDLMYTGAEEGKTLSITVIDEDSAN